VQRISDMRPFLFKNSTTLNNFFMGIKPSATSMVATRGQMKTMMAEGGVPAANPLAQATPEQQVMEQGEVEHEAMEQETPDGPPSGVIGSESVSPEDSIADDVPMEVPEGAFIINAAAAEVAGYGDIKKMIMDAIGVAKRLGIEIATGASETEEEEAVDLLVSKGEVYIEPTLAKIIGYDVLEKINNRGKKEVARRQQEAAAAEEQQAAPAPQAPQAPMQRGGFVKKKFADGGDVKGPSPSDVAMGDIEAGFETLRYYGDDPVLRLALDDPKGLSTLVEQEYEDDSGPVGMYDVDKDLITLTRKAIKPSDFVSPQTEYSDTLGHELMHKGDADAGTTGSIMKSFQLHAVIASKSIQASKDSKGRIGDDTFNNTYRLLKNYVSGFDNAKQIRKDITKAYTSGKTNSERGDNILAVLENVPEFREIRQEAEDNARKVLAERKQQASKKAQGFADGGYTQSLTSNDVAERVASVIGVREDAQYAKDLSRLESSRQQFDDDDKSEDTLRHILLGGLISPTNKDTLLGKVQGFLGGVGIEARERKNFIGDYVNEESAIDANNNKYGAALRKRYETQEEFEQAAIDAVIALREGKPIEIDGLTPRMSFGNPPKEESSRASQGN